MSKQKKAMLKKGDLIYAKISTVSMKNTVKDSKIALTMKSDGLGKPEWYKSSGAPRNVLHRGQGGSGHRGKR